MATNTPRLRRVLSLPVLTLYGLGNVLGAGIYVLIGKVAGVSGEQAGLAFVLAAFIAGLTSFSYMELSSRYPVSAGASVYVHQGFGNKRLSQIVGLLMILSALFSSAALARGFAGYLSQIVQIDENIAIIVLFIVLGSIVAWGIRMSAGIAAVFTLIELAGLGLIIWAGRQILIDPASYSGFVSIDIGNIGPVLLGSFLAFYAYIGFEDMVNVAEEVKQPKRTIPAALLISLVVSTILYILVVVVAITAIPLDKLAASSAPLSLVFSSLGQSDSWVITLIGVTAAVNGILVHIILVTRVLYGMAERGWVHSVFRSVHANTRTPLFGTLLTIILMLTLTLLFPLISLAQLTSFTVLSVFALVNAALILIKRRGPTPQSATAIPVWVPWLGMITCILLTIYQIVQMVI